MEGSTAARSEGGGCSGRCGGDLAVALREATVRENGGGGGVSGAEFLRESGAFSCR